MCTNQTYLTSTKDCLPSCPTGFMANPYGLSEVASGRECGGEFNPFRFSTKIKFLILVWNGRPLKDGLFFHRTVPQSEVCAALGFFSSLSSSAGNIKRESVCSIWYPQSIIRTFTPCPDSEPTYFNISCSTRCPSNCNSCSNASVCGVCTAGYFLSSNGQCVRPANCGTGFFGGFDSLLRPVCKR